MSPRALLLRVLLCISLVLNGSGYAVAATQMHMAHLAADNVAAMDDADMPPCHSHGDSVEAVAKPAPMTDCESTHAPTQPDCCQSSQCACDCLQHATATLVQLPSPAATIARAPGIATMHDGHAAPALANLIRPPIA